MAELSDAPGPVHARGHPICLSCRRARQDAVTRGARPADVVLDARAVAMDDTRERASNRANGRCGSVSRGPGYRCSRLVVSIHRSFAMSATQHETIAVGALSIRFVVDPTQSGGSISMFECTVPAGSRCPRAAQSRRVRGVGLWTARRGELHDRRASGRRRSRGRDLYRARGRAWIREPRTRRRQVARRGQPGRLWPRLLPRAWRRVERSRWGASGPRGNHGRDAAARTHARSAEYRLTAALSRAPLRTTSSCRLRVVVNCRRGPWAGGGRAPCR